MNSTAIKSRFVFIGNAFQPATIVMEQGKIQSVLAYDAPDDALDYGDLHILPGLVDSHVHINEPGRTDWEGFDTATHAACAGGITTLVDMPLNCIPVTITREALQEKLAVLDDKLMIDAAFWGGATATNLDGLDALLSAGVYGVKSFTIDSGIDEFQPVDEAMLEASMRKVAEHGLVHLIHAELDDGVVHSDNIGSSYQKYLASRPASWEDDAISMVIRVMHTLKAEGLDPKAHIVHLSSANALPLIKAAKEAGLKLTVETCPHYLTLVAETIPDGKTTFKCCPPIREKANADALWQALDTGLIDCVVSDHSPCTPQLKHIDSGDLEAAWGGISGLQFGLSLMWTEAKTRDFALDKLAALMTVAPADIAGLNKGRIAVGQSADLCIFDPNGSYIIDKNMIHHKHKVTPYEGKTVFGVVKETWLKGYKIYNDGAFISERLGEPLLKNHHKATDKT